MDVIGAISITALIIGLHIVGYVLYKKNGEKHGYKDRFELG